MSKLMPDDEIKTIHSQHSTSNQYLVAISIALFGPFCFQKYPGCVHELIKLGWFVNKVVQAGPAGPPPLCLLEPRQSPELGAHPPRLNVLFAEIQAFRKVQLELGLHVELLGLQCLLDVWIIPLKND